MNNTSHISNRTTASHGNMVRKVLRFMMYVYADTCMEAKDINGSELLTKCRLGHVHDRYILLAMKELGCIEMNDYKYMGKKRGVRYIGPAPSIESAVSVNALRLYLQKGGEYVRHREKVIPIPEFLEVLDSAKTTSYKNVALSDVVTGDDAEQDDERIASEFIAAKENAERYIPRAKKIAELAFIEGVYWANNNRK